MLFAIKDWSVCAFLNQTVNVEFLFFYLSKIRPTPNCAQTQSAVGQEDWNICILNKLAF